MFRFPSFGRSGAKVTIRKVESEVSQLPREMAHPAPGDQIFAMTGGALRLAARVGIWESWRHG